MTTDELLACVTAGAKEYIQNTINTKNKSDYQKLKKLFDEQLFEAKNFEDTELDITVFDWRSLERDRNWWWQIQALPFLNWFVNSFSLQNDEERSHYFSKCLDSIRNWGNQANLNSVSPLVWHDHAAAFRGRNISNWLVFCYLRKISLGELYAEPLGELIKEHLDWLQQDKHYSQHTNHGFDQAMIALTIASMFSDDGFEAYRQLNCHRLKDEITFAFTEEGVHKENSPGYQKMMLGRLKQLRTLRPLGQLNVARMGERYIERAEAFLRAITLPDGYLPMTGDTRGEDAGLVYVQKEQIDVLDYSTSGYVIIRGQTNDGLEIFLLFKNTHESNYHRHDDDLMLFLYIDGEVVLGDGGLGTHQEKDPKRKFLRSALSHSVPLIDRKYIRDKEKLPAKPILKVERLNCLVKGISNGYGVDVTRVIDYSDIASGNLVIEDSCDKSTLASNWFLNDHAVLLNKRGFDMSTPSFSLKFEMAKNQFIKLFKGWDNESFSGSAIMSNNYSNFIPAVRVVTGGNRKNQRMKLSMCRLGEIDG
ncbi:heparinase II/III-like protein [Idiomarina fontislapidosi]|nr:heparinase II/III-like protein [Idiomarina fontislapidosi]